MWRIKTAAKDCLAALFLLVLFRPFGIGGDKSKIVAIVGVIILVFISSILTSLLVSLFLKEPEQKTLESELRRLTIEHLLIAPILAAFVILYIAWYVVDDISKAWAPDGSFSLWPYISALVCTTIVTIPIYIWNRSQLKKEFLQAEIEELQTLNALLETEQKMLRSRLSKDNTTGKIIIHGDSRESLVVNPQDIMYIESVGNYLSIVYFNDSDLCQTRLRSSLKEVEETLEAFPFMVHTHRAFLVNINFITQISGNSSGYKVNMFSTDKVLPVSKSNVFRFREKLQELGKTLG